MGKFKYEGLTKRDETIYMDILREFLYILDNKRNDALTFKKKRDAWSYIRVLFRSRTGKTRSARFLRGKFMKMRNKMKKLKKSPSMQMLLSCNDGFENEINIDHSALSEPYDPEAINPVEDPLQVPTEVVQKAIIEIDPLQISTGIEEVHPPDIFHSQSIDHSKTNSLFSKEDGFCNNENDSNQAKDSFCREKTHNVITEKINLQKRMLEIEEARNEREQIMLKMEIERNERDKKLFHIENERNEREKQILQLKIEKNNQNKKNWQLEAKVIEQNKVIRRLEAERNVQEKKIQWLTAERNSHHTRIPLL